MSELSTTEAEEDAQLDAHALLLVEESRQLQARIAFCTSVVMKSRGVPEAVALAFAREVIGAEVAEVRTIAPNPDMPINLGPDVASMDWFNTRVIGKIESAVDKAKEASHA